MFVFHILLRVVVRGKHSLHIELVPNERVAADTSLLNCVLFLLCVFDIQLRVESHINLIQSQIYFIVNIFQVRDHHELIFLILVGELVDDSLLVSQGHR